MQIKSIEELNIPENLKEILEEEGYWEDDSFEPILITIEEVEVKGEDIISYQASFEVLDNFEDIDGDQWEEIIRNDIREKDPDLSSRINGDSESSTCVMWTENEDDFEKMLGYIIEMLENKK